jgi:hypothetical protein
MTFDPKAYGETVASILALDGAGERMMPLARGTCSSTEARQRLKQITAAELFKGSRAPDAALSGLYLYFSCMEESHNLSQSLETPDGSFWHGILHRQEPDPGNAAYWFRRVGAHPIFPLLRAAAFELGVDFGPRWDPFAFIDLCGTGDQRALEVQRAEWQLLFDYCAAKKRSGNPS